VNKNNDKVQKEDIVLQEQVEVPPQLGKLANLYVLQGGLIGYGTQQIQLIPGDVLLDMPDTDFAAAVLAEVVRFATKEEIKGALIKKLERL
jgi:hypothetical protein